MGVTATAGNYTETKDYELLEGGVYPGRCIQIVDLGSHPNTHPQAKAGSVKHEVLIVWELSGELMQDGRPFVVNKRYTLSLGDKAILRSDLKSWRGRDFTAEELQGFAMKNILDAPCMLNIAKVASKKDAKKFFNNVLSIMPLAKGMTVADRVNDLVDFAIEDRGNKELMEKLYPWVRKVIEESLETKGAMPSEQSDSHDDGFSMGNEKPPF